MASSEGGLGHRNRGQGLQPDLVYRVVPEQRSAARHLYSGCRARGDSELAEFFRRAQQASRKGAEQAKHMLAQRLGG